jgi:hypothetical protein
LPLQVESNGEIVSEENEKKILCNHIFIPFSHFPGDQRLSGHKKNDHNNFKELTKKEVDVILGYIQLWPQRFVQLIKFSSGKMF